MFVFLRLFILCLFSLSITACIDLEEDLSDSQRPEAQAFKQQLISNQWKSDGTPSNGILITSYLFFLSDNQVSKRRFFTDSSGSIVEISGTADYSIGKKVILPSGLSAFELNLMNKSISFDSDLIPPPVTLELVIIEDDILYFGLPKIIETCKGEYLERVITDAVVENGSIRDFDTRTECYARPNSINFDKPFRKVEDK